MSGYQLTRIGDIAKVKGGKRLPSGRDVQDVPTAHPYIRVVDMGDDGINTASVKYITDDVFERIRRYTIDSRDVYISIAGTIGRVGIVPTELSGANLTENAAKITEIANEVDHIYLMHFLRGSIGQSLIASQTGGTSQPKLALFRIEDIKLPLPPLANQRRIADILSSYDDLIENNQRRMALLKEAARMIYQEWFVRLRFPGHKNARIVDGVPEGWEKKRLGDVISLKYGKALKATDRQNGSVPVFGSSGVVGFHNKPLTIGPAIIVGRKGNAGSVFWSDSDFWPIDTVFYIHAEQCDYFVYHNLQHQHFISSDVAVPGLNRDYAHSLPIVLPVRDIRSEFDVIVTPIYNQIWKLRYTNEKLQQARDILLPKLMSGEIDVAGLEIGVTSQR